ncbi:MAG TPA: T9SS type A sorting domain-containing protein, partial [Ignavibacteriaceae bacterium]
VQLKVYDVLGKEIATLVNEEKPAGNYEVDFNANGLSSGVYFYQLRSGDFVQTNKMILLR